MKGIKKLLTFIVVIALVFTNFAPVLAADDVNTFTSVQESRSRQYIAGITYGLMTDNNDVYIYCLHAEKHMGSDMSYTYSAEETASLVDDGIAYILEKGETFIKNNISGVSDEQLAYTMQMALWYYQYKKQGKSWTVDGVNRGAKIESEAVTGHDAPGNEGTEVDGTTAAVSQQTAKVVLALYDAAKNYKSENIINVSKVEAFKKSQDGKYYYSDPITVSSSSNLKSYKVTLNANVEGAEIIKASDNSKIASGTSLTVADKVYVRFPVANAKEGSKTTLTLKFTGVFEQPGFKVYLPTDNTYQSVVRYNPVTVEKEANREISITPIPDTDANTSAILLVVASLALAIGSVVVVKTVKQN